MTLKESKLRLRWEGIQIISQLYANREGGQKTPSIPFKFNSQWLKDEGSINLVRLEGVIFDPNLRKFVSFQWATNLKKVAIVILKWDFDKQHSYQLNENLIEFSFFGGSHFLLCF
jgi:hypothetical protein